MLPFVIVALCALLPSSADATTAVAVPSLPAEPFDSIDFERSIRPLFAAHCVSCHGEKKQAGGLRLDRRADALAGARGGTRPVIVAGQPEESSLLERVLATDEDERMPQKAPALARDEIETLRAWIQQGARWPADGSELVRHWSYEPPRLPAIPHVKSTARCRNPIDRFVLARLEREGLDFAPEADAATLLRRVALDLTGLPPTVEQVAAFESESRTDRHGAYERALARLLASSAYAEKQAQHWLDLARYADTNGYEKDERRSMWPWRDWVIHAFERDMPFDRFTLEQLAGDLLPNATLEQRVATGFQRNTLVNQEGGTDPEEFRDAAVIDRTNTLGSVWLGSTIACAQCHDHKYDPFTQKDYFQLYAFFDQTVDTGNKLDPVLSLPTKEQEQALAEIEKRKTELEARQRDLVLATERDLEAQRDRWPGAASIVTWVMAELPDSDELVLGGAGGALIVNAPPLAGFDVEVAFERGGSAPHAATLVRCIRLRAGSAPRPDAPNGHVGEPRATDVRLRLGARRGASERALWLARASIDRDGATGGDVMHGDDQGALTLALPLDGDRGSSQVDVYAELEVATRVESDEELVLHLHVGPNLGNQLSFGCASSPDEELARRRFALDARVWERAAPISVESTPVGFAATLGLEPGADAPTTWSAHPEWKDGVAHSLPGERFAHFLRRELMLRQACTLTFELGGDDGFRAWLDGQPLAAHLDWPGFVEKQVSVDERVAAGEHVLLLEVINSSGPGEFWCRVQGSVREHASEASISAARVAPQARSTEERERFAVFVARVAEERSAALSASRKQLAADEEKLRAQIATTLVMEERREPRVTHIHQKGSYLSPGDVVTPDVPAFLPPLPADAPRNRLGLAQWLVSPENPLTARVFVNRMWERFFGRGLVATSDDFGTRGDAPTHPELLDWLAHDFVEHGWSVKHLCETIVTSSTYRQSSNWTRELLERDAENHLLARQSRPRMEVETLRDVALATSGLLATEVGGPSVMPPQPDGVWAPVYSNDRWETANGAARYRRGLYTFWRRSSPYATFQLFDAPSREQTCTRRARTNTPLQALALLNDPAFVECADALAKRIEAQPSGTNERLAWAWRAVTSRAAETAEIAALRKLFDAENAGAKPASASQPGDATHRAWTRVANVLLNLDEALTRP